MTTGTQPVNGTSSDASQQPSLEHSMEQQQRSSNNRKSSRTADVVYQQPSKKPRHKSPERGDEKAQTEDRTRKDLQASSFEQRFKASRLLNTERWLPKCARVW